MHRYPFKTRKDADTDPDRYTKALDSIKSLRKERAVELKLDEERLKSLGIEKDRADKVRQRQVIVSSMTSS